MAKVIAIAGESGSGKTCCASLIIRSLLKHRALPILAIDAGAGAELGKRLGLNAGVMLDTVISQFDRKKTKMPAGVLKKGWLDFKLYDAITESNDVDLVTLGAGWGRGCNCFTFDALGSFIEKLSGNYRFIVIDDALDFLRLKYGTIKHIDDLIVVSNHSIAAIGSTNKNLLPKDLKSDETHISLIINMAPQSGTNPILARALTFLGCEPSGSIPWDDQIAQRCLTQSPLTELPDTSIAAQAIEPFINQLLSNYWPEGRESRDN